MALELEHILVSADHARKQGDWDGAASLYEQVLRRDSRSKHAAIGMGICLQKMGRPTHAVNYLAQVATLGTDDPEVFASLGNCYFALGNMDAAAHAFYRAVGLDRESAQHLVPLAHTLVKKGEVEEAESCLLRAIELDPGLASAHDVMAYLLPEMGRFADAKESAWTASMLAPEHPAYWVRYVYAGKVVKEDRDRQVVDRLRAMSASDNINGPDRIRVEYGLGKALEDLEQYRESLQHYVRANTLAGREMNERGQGFDPPTHRQEVDFLIETYTKERLAERSVHGSPSELPVLIVGMMRSGTTLTEQILSSHPEIGGAGELDFWVQMGPRTVEAPPEVIASTAEQYLGLLNRLRPGNRRVVDKMPQNYMSLGPIVTALPQARIIHCRRDPRDTCLSIFTVPFAFHPPFAYSFKNLAFTYRQYLRMMEHWREVLPADRFIEVDYEEMVADPEGTTRRLLDFVGVEWDEACLHPEKNDRRVTTPSRWQVRQPVYKKSVGRWARFAPWLDPMLEEWGVDFDF